MHTGSSRGLGRVVQLGGVAAFIASLGWFAWMYASAFSKPATATPVFPPALTNTLWFTLFAAHHSIFAREGAKELLARVVPAGYARTVYVWIASILFALMTWNWQPVPGVLWAVDRPFSVLLHAAQAFAFALGLMAGRRIDVRELSGVRPARDRADSAPVLSDRGPFAVVRHPLNLSVLLLVWPVATMTGTRLVFAACVTVYVLIAIPLEERDLRRGWGREYDDYEKKVRYRLIPFVY